MDNRKNRFEYSVQNKRKQHEKGTSLKKRIIKNENKKHKVEQCKYGLDFKYVLGG